ncbi:MAG: hypothetical protein WD688_03710 [Candidatus Binatia bacterium]
MRISRATVTVLAVLLLVGCWLPEDFVASLDIRADKSFTFTYDGVLAFGPALAEIKERGVKDVSYIGNGRFKLRRYVMSGIAKPGTEVFLDLVKFKGDKNGNIVIEGVSLSAEDRHQLSALGVNFNGTVKLNSALPVLSENADAKPFLRGLFGPYKWIISIDRSTQPRVVLKG